jgi:RND superfamily putative drug exporter
VLDRWGSFVARRAIVVLLAGLLLAVGAGVYGAGVFGSLSQGGFDDASAESSRELDREQEVDRKSVA